jgi:hypothetical protein
MTSLWGPLGWMTLHSVSLLYPENPSQEDKAILKRYMDAFRETITCIHCYNHFKIIFQNYTSSHPEWADSKFNFFMFVARAHNTVNHRLNKPKPATVQECITAFRSNTLVTNAFTYRAKYIEYLIRSWAREMSGEAMMKVGQAKELQRINTEYWNKRSEGSTNSFQMDANVLDLVDENPALRSIMRPNGSLAHVSSKSFSIGLKGGRFQLRR